MNYKQYRSMTFSYYIFPQFWGACSPSENKIQPYICHTLFQLRSDFQPPYVPLICCISSNVALTALTSFLKLSSPTTITT